MRKNLKFVEKKVRFILESNFFVRYLIHQTTTTNQNNMKSLPTKNGKIVKDAFFMPGIGWVREIVKSRINQSGVNEPFIELEIL